MPRLTDTHLVILSAAAARKSRCILPLPKSLKVTESTATRVLRALLKTGLVEEQPAKRGVESWREDDDGQRLALLITEPGMAALDGGAAASASKPAAGRVRKVETPKRSSAQDDAGPSQTNGLRGKVGMIASLLQRAEGVPLSELQKATGWQPHSVRAALTGLRKRGYTVLREKQDGTTRYRIAAA